MPLLTKYITNITSPQTHQYYITTSTLHHHKHHIITNITSPILRHRKHITTTNHITTPQASHHHIHYKTVTRQFQATQTEMTCALWCSLVLLLCLGPAGNVGVFLEGLLPLLPVKFLYLDLGWGWIKTVRGDTCRRWELVKCYWLGQGTKESGRKQHNSLART
ncbi:hypothetical protein E2C01_038523 [Portunus trituberculatus]|uniref:Uncharacterized protein n=1 Tax=Portunus trituberculatus TaxID=210409 RepID=A0A5B7FI79_PORTR|nr:hypothetical protein [Portunus trituberculatus]